MYIYQRLSNQKINAFPFEKLEEIILEIAKKELKHIESVRWRFRANDWTRTGSCNNYVVIKD